MIRNILYSIVCLGFCTMIGGAAYEHLAVVPGWSAAPPASLSMFQGEYGLNPAIFWQIIHPVNLVLFIINLVLFWKTPKRNHLLYTLLAYFTILIITSIYFVPELISITTTKFSIVADAELTARALKWEQLSIVRLIVLLGLAIFLISGLSKRDTIY